MTHNNVTISDIKATMANIHQLLEDKGRCNVNVAYEIKHSTESNFYITFCLTGGNGKQLPNSYESEFIYGDTFHEALKKTYDWIDTLKSCKETARENFMQKMGRLIDEGKHLDLSVEVETQLKLMMEKLTKNILEDKRVYKTPSVNIDDHHDEQIPF